MNRYELTLFICAAAIFGCETERYRAVPIDRTPYDIEWYKVRNALADIAGYRYHRAGDADAVWQLPETTERERRGDCAALATLLYQRMLKQNVQDGRIVFGFRGGLWHAWVEWRGHILDPAISSRPMSDDTGSYRPAWGYDLAGRYRFELAPVGG
ncbi:MAG: hypothetical protein AB1696_18560 [Planctomycetota bacterium]